MGKLCVGVLLMALMGKTAQAASIDALDRGYYAADGTTNAGDLDYRVGRDPHRHFTTTSLSTSVP
jgi:hypothetical protein